MTNSSRHDIYNAVIRRMVNEAIKAEETRFLLRHNADSNEMLLQYLQDCAEELGHSPWPREIVGGLMIRERFGTWENALEAADLSMPTTPDKASEFARIQLETIRQKQIYRDKKLEKKKRAQERMKIQQEKKMQNP